MEGKKKKKKRLNCNNLKFIIISLHRKPVFQAYHLPAWLYLNELPEQLVEYQPPANMKKHEGFILKVVRDGVPVVLS